MMTAEDYDAWLRLARLYEFQVVDEPLYIMHAEEGREHIRGFSSRMPGHMERITSKHMDYLHEHSNVYWAHLRYRLPYYIKCGEYGKFFKVWTQTVRLQPSRVISNASIVIKSLMIPPYTALKSLLRKNLPGIFVALKKVKIKLTARREI